MKRMFYFWGAITLCALLGCSGDSKEESYLNLETSLLTFSVDGESKDLSISCNVDWSISGLPSWLKASAVSGIGNSIITLTAEANEAMDDRNSSFKVYTNDRSVSRDIVVKQEGTHVSPIQVDNISEKMFNGKASTVYEDSIVVTSNTRWIAEGPSWLKATFMGNDLSLNGDIICEGSGVIYLAPSETYTGNDARQDVISIKTLNATHGMEIPVRQLGKDDIQCIFHLIQSDGFLFGLKFGSNVAAFRWGVYEEELPPSEITYDNIRSYWTYYKAQTDATLWVSNISPNTSYTLYFIGINDNNYFTTLDRVNKVTIQTASDINQPMANITDVTYANGEWQWNTTMNNFAKGYFTQAFYKSYFEGMNLMIMKPYFAYMMKYLIDIYQLSGYTQKSGWFKERTTDDLIICTWAVGADGKRSTTIDMYVAEKENTEAKSSYTQKRTHNLQTGIIDFGKMEGLKFSSFFNSYNHYTNY